MSGIVQMNAISVQTVEKTGSVHYNTKRKKCSRGRGNYADCKAAACALGLIVVFLVIVLFVTVYTFVLQLNYSNMAVDTAVAWDTRCADAIHRLVSNTFTRDDFENITTRSDMSTERYYELQSKLNELRSLNSTRYLYTAKRGADGRLIYLIDGLDLDADDFAYP